MVYSPPGSGYASEQDEVSFFPDSYEPTMEYPGTMRPGRTRENISFQDLPIGDDDPNPVPWPHFQEIDFYHVWPAPHPHAELVNDMIEREGRWATPEEEAEMMRDARRGVRLLKEMEEAEKKSFVVVDDDEDDDEDEGVNEEDEVEGEMSVGTNPGDQEEAAVMQRMKDMLAAGAAAVGTGAAEGVATRTTPKDEAIDIDMNDIDFDLGEDGEEQGEGDEDDEDDGDFLMDLGLDKEDDDDDDDEEAEGNVASLAHDAGTGAVDKSAVMDEEDDAGIDLEDLDVDDDEEYFSSNEDDDDTDAEDNPNGGS
jgi:hypothetical protein